jgi:DHA2 family methylenomycin A resistance protein-like MFS transporter
LRAGRSRQHKRRSCKLTVNEMPREGSAPASPTESASKPRSAASFTNWIPAVATGAVFMIVLDTSIVNLALARIGTELNSGLATLQWLVDGYALVFASLLLGAGALGDRFGAKDTFMYGLWFIRWPRPCVEWLPLSRRSRIRASCRGSGPLRLPNSLAALNTKQSQHVQDGRPLTKDCFNP